MPVITFALSEETDKKLEEDAEKQGVTKETATLKILRDHVSESRSLKNENLELSESNDIP